MIIYFTRTVNKLEQDNQEIDCNSSNNSGDNGDGNDDSSNVGEKGLRLFPIFCSCFSIG